MSNVSVKTAAGASAGTLELDDAVFGRELNVPLMHQVVTAQLAARRAGTQNTRTRGRFVVVAPSRGARRARAEPAKARSGRPTGGVVVWHWAPSPGATPSAPRRR